MITKKKFDAVQMKREIQARLRHEQQKLEDREIVRRRQEWLQASDHPLAQLWRKGKPS